MKSKILKLVLGTLIFSLVVFASVFEARNALAEDANTATPKTEVEVLPSTEPEEITISEQILRQYAETKILTTSTNGFDISVSNFRIEDNKFKADGCFLTTMKDDWAYRAAQVIFENQDVIRLNETRAISIARIQENGQTFIDTFLGDPPQFVSQEVEPNSIPDYRCDTLIFNLADKTPTAKFEMKIDAMRLVPKEGEGCLQYGDQVREVLKQREINIEFECQQGDFSSLFVVTKKTDAVSQEEAQNIVSNAYRQIRTIEGPWIFSGELAEEPKLDIPSLEATVEETASPTSSEVAPTP